MAFVEVDGAGIHYRFDDPAANIEEADRFTDAVLSFLTAEETR